MYSIASMQGAAGPYALTQGLIRVEEFLHGLARIYRVACKALHGFIGILCKIMHRKRYLKHAPHLAPRHKKHEC